MTFCQSHYTFRHNTMTCQIKQPHLSAGLLLQPNIPRNIIASPPFAGILLYTRIYTTVIARSAATWQSPPVIARSVATWQSSSITPPRSRVYFYIPQNTISLLPSYNPSYPTRTHWTHQPQCPQHPLCLLSPFSPLCPSCVSMVAPRATTSPAFVSVAIKVRA